MRLHAEDSPLKLLPSKSWQLYEKPALLEQTSPKSLVIENIYALIWHSFDSQKYKISVAPIFNAESVKNESNFKYMYMTISSLRVEPIRMPFSLVTLYYSGYFPVTILNEYTYPCIFIYYTTRRSKILDYRDRS